MRSLPFLLGVALACLAASVSAELALITAYSAANCNAASVRFSFYYPVGVCIQNSVTDFMRLTVYNGGQNMILVHYGNAACTGAPTVAAATLGRGACTNGVIGSGVIYQYPFTANGASFYFNLFSSGFGCSAGAFTQGPLYQFFGNCYQAEGSEPPHGQFAVANGGGSSTLCSYTSTACAGTPYSCVTINSGVCLDTVRVTMALASAPVAAAQRVTAASLPAALVDAAAAAASPASAASYTALKSDAPQEVTLSAGDGGQPQSAVYRIDPFNATAGGDGGPVILTRAEPLVVSVAASVPPQLISTALEPVTGMAQVTWAPSSTLDTAAAAAQTTVQALSGQLNAEVSLVQLTANGVNLTSADNAVRSAYVNLTSAFGAVSLTLVRNSNDSVSVALNCAGAVIAVFNFNATVTPAPAGNDTASQTPFTPADALALAGRASFSASLQFDPAVPFAPNPSAAAAASSSTGGAASGGGSAAAAGSTAASSPTGTTGPTGGAVRSAGPSLAAVFVVLLVALVRPM